MAEPKNTASTPGRWRKYLPIALTAIIGVAIAAFLLWPNADSVAKQAAPNATDGKPIDTPERPASTRAANQKHDTEVRRRPAQPGLVRSDALRLAPSDGPNAERRRALSKKYSDLVDSVELSEAQQQEFLTAVHDLQVQRNMPLEAAAKGELDRDWEQHHKDVLKEFQQRVATILDPYQRAKRHELTSLGIGLAIVEGVISAE